MKVALLVPDGVGIRNFLLGSFPAEASALGPLQVQGQGVHRAGVTASQSGKRRWIASTASQAPSNASTQRGSK